MRADAYIHAVVAAAPAAVAVAVAGAVSDVVAPIARTVSGLTDAGHLAFGCGQASSAHLEGRVAVLKECRWRIGGCFRHLSTCRQCAVMGFDGDEGSD